MFRKYYSEISLQKLKYTLYMILIFFSIYWYLLIDIGFQNRPNELLVKTVYFFSFVDEILGVLFFLSLSVLLLKLFELEKSAWKIIFKNIFLIFLSVLFSLVSYYFIVTSLPKEELDSLAPVVLVLYYGKSIPLLFSVSLIILNFITGKSENR